MEERLFLPVLSHFENKNFWTASGGRMRYRVDPVLGEDQPPALTAQVWEGPWRLQDSAAPGQHCGGDPLLPHDRGGAGGAALMGPGLAEADQRPAAQKHEGDLGCPGCLSCRSGGPGGGVTGLSPPE